KLNRVARVEGATNSCSRQFRTLHSATDYSPGLLDAGFKTESAVLIARTADGHARTDVVLQLDDLVLGLRHVRREGNENVSRDTMLDRNTRPAILLGTTPAEHGIHR